jgi:23S rRNA C2498 (ribose-2'-O)-methylase RlmM
MIALSSRKIEKGWIRIHVINGVIHGRTGFRNSNSARKLVGTSYVITRFVMAPESLLVYYTITDKSASFHWSIPRYRFPWGTRSVVNLN